MMVLIKKRFLALSTDLRANIQPVQLNARYTTCQHLIFQSLAKGLGPQKFTTLHS